MDAAKPLTYGEAVGLEIRHLMVDANLTSAELSARTGLGLSTIGRILKGERDARIDSVTAIARALGIRTSVLLQSAEGRLT